jgi:hypothetical protein
LFILMRGYGLLYSAVVRLKRMCHGDGRAESESIQSANAFPCCREFLREYFQNTCDGRKCKSFADLHFRHICHRERPSFGCPKKGIGSPGQKPGDDELGMGGSQVTCKGWREFLLYLQRQCRFQLGGPHSRAMTLVGKEAAAFRTAKVFPGAGKIAGTL